TRSYGDWSSDVCSSDLLTPPHRAHGAQVPNFIGRQAAWLPFNEACPYYLISCGGELAPRFLNTPLHQPGLNRRMYPFLGLAIVGLVTVKPLTAVAASPELMLALLIGAALTLAPVAPDRAIPAGRWIGSLPVAAGFILASYNLWSSGSA